MEDSSSYHELRMPETPPHSTSHNAVRKLPVLLLLVLLFLGVFFVTMLQVSKAPERHFDEMRVTGVKVDRFDQTLWMQFYPTFGTASTDKEELAECFVLVNLTSNAVLSSYCKKTQPPGQAGIESFFLFQSGSSSFWTSWYMILLYVLLGIVLVICPALVWLLYPKTPEVTLEKLQLDGVSTDSKLMPTKESYLPKLKVDVNLIIGLRIRNRNFIGVSYEKITIYVNYKSYQLCFADLTGGAIRPRSESVIESSASIKLAQILYKSPELVTDAAMQELPVNLVVEFSGYVGREWFKAPVKLAVSLDSKIDPVSSEVTDQDYQVQV